MVVPWNFEPPDYRVLLRKFVDGYSGAYEKAIALTPDVFEFYARLLMNDRVGRGARSLITSVLAYFVVPDDVLPESELGPYGLLDDLHVAGHVYRILRRDLPNEILTAAWRGELELEAAMDLVYTESRAGLGRLRRKVLRVAGLS